MAKRLPPEVLDFFRKQGAKGGKIGGAARARNLTPEQLAEIGRKGAAKRWGPKLVK